MKHGPRPVEIPVYVVTPPRVLLLDVAGPVEVLRKANLEQESLRFVVTYIGPAADVGSSIGLDLAGISPLPERLPDGALVIVPGSADAPLGAAVTSREDDAAYEREIVDWLRRTVRSGVRLVSICSGALLAARVRENRLYVEDRERLTSAGVTAGVDLMLHIVAGMAGRACALAVARYLVVYLRRGGADPQLSPWLEGRNHIHPAVHRAQDAVAADPARDWAVGALASASATSPRHLSRLFNEHAGMSVTDYVNRIRVALARELLTGSRLDMESVAERAGFASSRQLRRAWGRVHDLPPSGMRSNPAARLQTHL